MNSTTQDYLTRKEAAAHLRSIGYLIAPRTLARMAAKGMGPPYRRTLHRITSYRRSDLEMWARENSVEINPKQPRGRKAQGLAGALSALR